MLSVEEAKKKIVEVTQSLDHEVIPVEHAQGRILAKDLIAPFSLPPFRQSAMDGYAVKMHAEHSYTCVAEVAAGSSANPSIAAGEAVRIFTGAKVPDDADTVIIQEWIEETDQSLPRTIRVIEGKQVKSGANIRPLGEQLRAGEVALKKGCKLNGSALGFAQSFGLTELSVYKLPQIHLVITGDELAKPGTVAEAGQIFESNSITLSKTLEPAGYTVDRIHYVPDDLAETIQTLSACLKEADLVLVSGGISVGDHDHVLKACQTIGVQEHFYKVKQKPGKPLFFGQKGKSTLFGLPGNPASALTCMHHYVIPHLAIRCGNEHPWPKKVMLPLSADFTKKGDRAVFLKACLSEGTVEILGAQASSMLSSYVIADGLVYLPFDKSEVKEGELVEFHLI